MALIFKKYLQVFITISVYISFSYSAVLNKHLSRNRRSSEVLVQGLYNSTDQVDELTFHNFNQKIYHSNYVWLVEFYNTWCGHCQRYAPTYKAVAEYFKSSKDVFIIAAVDCANEINQPLCRNFEIMGYPTLRYFHENFIEGPKNLGLTIHKAGVDDVDGNIRAVINLLISEQKENRAQMLPNLQPYNYPNISRIFHSVKSGVQFGFLILESDKSLLGVEAALTFHKMSNVFITYSPISNDELAKYLNIDQFPALIILSHGSSEIKVEEKIPRIDHANRYIAAFLKQRGSVVDEYIQKEKQSNAIPQKDPQESEQQEMISRVKKMGDIVFQMDLETALRKSLKQEVPKSKIIDGEQLKALRAYLKVLVKYFPLGKRGHFFLNDLSNLVTNSNSIRGADIYTLMKNSEKEDQLIWSSPNDWLGCKGSSPANRGYPCGLWTMFHYLTVNAAEQNLGRKGIDPKEVLMAMHGYIKNFFGCADCAIHFQDMAANRSIQNVSSLSEAIIWLWEAHNVVNERLAGDATEDPQFPKIQFPLPERCPECRLTNGSWNTNLVEKYLKHMYGSINIRYIGSDTRILHMGLEGSSDNSSGMLGYVDSSMLLILYFASFLLLIILIRMFLKRGYRKKPYMHDVLGKV